MEGAPTGPLHYVSHRILRQLATRYELLEVTGAAAGAGNVSAGTEVDCTQEWGTLTFMHICV